MCELCDAGFRDTGYPRYGYLGINEPITDMYIAENIGPNGCNLECLVINKKWIVYESGDPNEPMKRALMKDDKSKEELLEAYEKISNTFDDFTQLMRKRVPYNDWPDHCKTAGVSDSLLGAVEDGPGKSIAVSPSKDVWDVLRERGLNPLGCFPTAVITRLEDIGRAQQKLKMILDEEIFESFGKHDPYWQDENPEFDDKLHTIRSRIACLHDNLWDLWAILRKEEE